MNSIGIDIVALHEVDIQRTVLPQFYSKIITAAELACYDAAAMPFYQYIWLLWSVKEAAYKCASRLQPGLLFSPTRTLVSNISILATAASNYGPELQDDVIIAQVEVNGLQLHTHSVVTENYIVSIACTGSFDEVQWDVRHIDDPHPDNQSAMVRQLVIKELQEYYPQPCNIAIAKTIEGLPIIVRDDSIVDDNMPLSFSHHGHYVAYAFVVPRRFKCLKVHSEPLPGS
ncbi:MAG: 4'-phosphopantetheinyl transferase superfamily protein [Flavipsychrobacter sp.]|nr:4'-phosphopantetheinyl transferase superfamily protein [Flavipsychrobacter sp.]